MERSGDGERIERSGEGVGKEPGGSWDGKEWGWRGGGKERGWSWEGARMERSGYEAGKEPGGSGDGAGMGWSGEGAAAPPAAAAPPLSRPRSRALMCRAWRGSSPPHGRERCPAAAAAAGLRRARRLRGEKPRGEQVGTRARSGGGAGRAQVLNAAVPAAFRMRGTGCGFLSRSENIPGYWRN